MRNYIIAVVLFVLAAFFNVSFFSATLLFIFKLALFGGFVYILYDIYSAGTVRTPASLPEEPHSAAVVESPSSKPAPRPEDVMTSPDETPRLSKLLSLQEGRLSVYLSRLFDIAFQFLHPQHGYFLLEEEDTLTLLASKTGDLPLKPRSTDFTAIFSLIKNSGQNILIENHLREDVHLNSLYDGINYKPGSIYIQRMSLDEGHALYWIFDAKSSGFFGAQDLDVPLKLESLCRETIQDFVFKINTQIEKSRWRTEMDLYQSLLSVSGLDDALEALVERIAARFEAHKLTIAMKDRGEKFPPTAHIVKTISMEEAGREGQKFELEDGLCGWVITRDKMYLLDDIEKGEYFIPRFSKDEKTNYGLHAFMALPLHYDQQAIGVVQLEHREPKKYTSRDARDLKEMIKVFEDVLKRIVDSDTKKEADR